LFNDSTVRVYDVDTGFKEQYRWKYDKALMGFVAFAPDSRTLYAGASDLLLRQWDPLKPAKDPETFYKGSSPGISFIACSPDGRWMASYGPDYRINLLERASGKKIREIIVGENYGNLAFAPDSRHLAVSVGTGVILVLRLEEAKK
jgi:WD40 repeat protein